MAIRSPKPVLTKPRAKKKEITINQITSLVKAEKALEKVSVLVITEVVRPIKAQAPTGSGLRTSPAMVERKMERSCQACGVTSGGLGTRKRTTMPTATEMIKGIGLTPWRAGAGAGDNGLESMGAEEAAAEETMNVLWIL